MDLERVLLRFGDAHEEVGVWLRLDAFRFTRERRLRFGCSMRFNRWAKREFGLSSINDAFTGMVTVIQRFDSALRLNVHFHTLVLDGVYVKNEDGAGLRFLRLPRPSEDDVYEVAMRTAKKVQANLEKRGELRTVNRKAKGRVGSSRRLVHVTTWRHAPPKR